VLAKRSPKTSGAFSQHVFGEADIFLFKLDKIKRLNRKILKSLAVWLLFLLFPTIPL
jgi:hypothetical protein